MSISKSKFGVTKEGKEVTKYTLKNTNGLEVSFIDLGGVITNIMMPDKDGNVDDIVLGYDKVSDYEVNMPSFGAPIGRYANRVSNASFSLNGKEYKLDMNDNTNCLHGGNTRYNRMMYDVETDSVENGDSITFSRLSPDGEQGLPGNLTVAITYTLNDQNELMVDYYAVGDADTIVNMTNHSYFNLGKGGHRCKDVLDQEVTIYADNYTPVNDILIPTGEIKSVENTALDFRKGKKIRDGLGAFDKDEKTVTEYDHNFVLNGDKICDVAKAAQFICEDTGRMLEVYTDQPGMQLYTAGTLTVENAKDGMSYGNFSGACFETQNFPNAINTEGFPNAVLKAGEEYSTTTVFRFSVND